MPRSQQVAQLRGQCTFQQMCEVCKINHKLNSAYISDFTTRLKKFIHVRFFFFQINKVNRLRYSYLLKSQCWILVIPRSASLQVCSFLRIQTKTKLLQVHTH